MARWDYRMVFSEDMDEIEDGECRITLTCGDEAEPQEFGRDLHYCALKRENDSVGDVHDLAEAGVSAEVGWTGVPELPDADPVRDVRLPLFGRSYAQFGGLGTASFHFDAPDDCYISYESDTCSDWAPQLRGRVPFLEPASYLAS